MSETIFLDVQMPTPWPLAPVADEKLRRFFSWCWKTMYVNLGRACNQKCRYCFQSSKEETHHSEGHVRDRLEMGRRLGLRNVVFTGGEPTTHPQLDRFAEMAMELGFGEWGLQTNGLLLADFRRVERWVGKGMTYCHVSFDSHVPATQNFLSGNPRTFDHLIAAFENLQHFGEAIDITIKSVVSRRNIHEMEGYVRFMESLRDRLGFDPTLVFALMVPPSPDAYDDLFLKQAAASKRVESMTRMARDRGFRAFFHHIPFCLVEDYKRLSIDWFSRSQMLREDGSILPSRMKTKGAACRRCALSDPCPGFSFNYLELYGDKEFIPIASDAPPAAAPPDSSAGPTEPPPEETVPPLARKSAARARPSGGRSSDVRLPAGCCEDSVCRYFSLKRIVHSVPSNLEREARIVLAGPDPLLHPALPPLIEALRQSNEAVWMESVGIRFVDPRLVPILKSCGLSGVRWLHLPSDSSAYDPYRNDKPLFASSLGRAAAALLKAGLPVEHVVVLADEPAEALAARLAELRRIPILARMPARWILSERPLKDSHSPWRDVKPLPPEKIAAAVALAGGGIAFEPDLPEQFPCRRQQETA